MTVACALCGQRTQLSPPEMSSEDGIVYQSHTGRIDVVCKGCHGDDDPQRLYRKYKEKFRRKIQ